MIDLVNFDKVQPGFVCTSLFDKEESNGDSTDRHEFLLNMNHFIVLTAIMMCLYFPAIIMIYIERNKQAVLFKSPILIMIGGINLFLDSMSNIVINTKMPKLMFEQETNLICYLSIVTTVIFHYIGYFAIVFRAQRIFKVMQLTKTYLN